MLDSSFSNLDLLHASSGTIGSILDGSLEGEDDLMLGGFLADCNFSTGGLTFVDPPTFEHSDDFDDLLETVDCVVLPDMDTTQSQISILPKQDRSEQQQQQRQERQGQQQGQGQAQKQQSQSQSQALSDASQAADPMTVTSMPDTTNDIHSTAMNLVEEQSEKISLMEEDFVPRVPNAATMERSASKSATATVVDLVPERQESPSASAATNDTDSTTTADGNDGEPTPSISAYQSGRWQQRFNELCEYRSQNGHCLVPSQWSENPQLSQWVKRQRYQYKLKREGQHSTMTDERIKLLEDKGFVWDSHSAFWEERLNELIQFSTRHGHCNVPTKYPDNPELAVWAKCQRRHFKLFITKGPKKSSMTMERIAKLTNVGFVFDSREFKKRLAAAAGVGAITSRKKKVGTKKSKNLSLSSVARTSTRMIPR